MCKEVNLFKKMESIVESTMDSYKTDFYEHDKKRLLRCKQENDNTYFWYVRESGTHLFDLHTVFVKDSYCNIMANYWLGYEPKIYKVKVIKIGKKYVYGTMDEISIEEMKSLLDNSLAFNYKDPYSSKINDIRVEYRWYYTGEDGLVNDFIGTLPEMQKHYYKLKTTGKKCEEIVLHSVYNDSMVG